MVVLLKKAPGGADESSLVARPRRGHRGEDAIPANVPRYRAKAMRDQM